MLSRLRTRAREWVASFRRSADDPFAEDVGTEDNVEIVVRDADGNVKDRISAHNLVTTVGKEKLAEQLVPAPATEKPKYIAVGKNGTAAAAGDTALGEEVKRKEATTRSASGKVLTMKVTFAAGEATATLKEMGIFAAAAAGSMYARVVFEAVAIGAADSIEVTWTLTYE